MRLFGVELRRFFARRAMRGLVLFALALIALVTVIAAVHSKERYETVSVGTCAFSVPPGATATTPPRGACPGGVEVQRRVERVDDRFHLDKDLGDSIRASGVTFLLLSVVFGSTFIGADYIAGALGGQLTFEPRRTRMFASKAAAVAAGSAIVTIALLLVVCGALVLIAETRGVVGHLDASWYAHRLGDLGRVTLCCAAIAVLAYSLTMIARRTVAGVITFLALAFIVEPALNASLHWFRGKTPIFAFVHSTVNAFGSQQHNNDDGFHSLAASAAVALVWTVAMYIAAQVVFGRREIR
jgi:ABC-type transport system involved in multi-copper enzyme maturation permease subunit